MLNMFAETIPHDRGPYVACLWERQPQTDPNHYTSDRLVGIVAFGSNNLCTKAYYEWNFGKFGHTPTVEFEGGCHRFLYMDQRKDLNLYVSIIHRSDILYIAPFVS